MNEQICLRGITLIPASKTVTLKELLARFPEAKEIYAVDFYVDGAENWQRIPGGWLCDYEGVVVVNIDHHAPAAEMMMFISSGNLAAEYVKVFGVTRLDASELVVVINHCDCDSISASSILVGLIEATEAFESAVIAADHTGAENLIADTLQSLEQERDLELSLNTILGLQNESDLSDRARAALEARQAERAELSELLEQSPKQIHRFGSVVLVEVAKRIPAEMLPALIPEASVILSTAPIGDGVYQVKARLGAAAPSGQTLFTLGISEYDTAFGGRWNAGSNKRGGGTTIAPVEYAKALSQIVEAKLA